MAYVLESACCFGWIKSLKVLWTFSKFIEGHLRVWSFDPGINTFAFRCDQEAVHSKYSVTLINFDQPQRLDLHVMEKCCHYCLELYSQNVQTAFDRAQQFSPMRSGLFEMCGNI